MIIAHKIALNPNNRQAIYSKSVPRNGRSLG